MYFVVDFEATCWEQPKNRDLNEIIEVGLVVCNNDGDIIKTYQSFVKPKINPILSHFCKKLTRIDQSVINESFSLREVLSYIIGDIESSFELLAQETPWVAFGEWDQICLQNDCQRNNCLFPFGNCIDLKSLYTNFSGCEKCGLTSALRREKIKIDGRPHRALDDALNAAKLARILVTPEILFLATNNDYDIDLDINF